jgi:fructoselysine 6-kinase
VRIVAVGECTRDKFRGWDLERPGGISLNFAINARGCGAAAALVSCVGDDGGAELIQAALHRAGVDASHLHQRAGPTPSQLIVIGAGGERTFPPGGYDPGVLIGFHLSSADRAFIAGFDVVAAPWFRQITHLFDEAFQAAGPGAKRVADFLDGADLGPGFAGLESLTARLDLAFFSGPPAVVDRLSGWAERTGAALVVTHGADGSTALIDGRRRHQAAVSVPIEERIDTTGCGDAFQAAFTVTFFGGATPAAALRAGAERAARVIRHLGGTAD